MPRYSVDTLVEALPGLAEALRARGVRVGTSQLVTAARIARSYSDLTGRQYLDEQEAILILASTLAVREAHRRLVEEEARALLARARMGETARGIESEIARRLATLGLRPGARVPKKRVLSGPRRERRERVAAYLELKRIGVIRGPPGSERVARDSEIPVIARRLARMGYTSVSEAARDSKRGWSEDDMMLQAEARMGRGGRLEEMDSRRLLKLGLAAARKGDRRLLHEVAEEVGRRLLRGERLDPDQARRLLRRAGLLSAAHLRALVAMDPSLAGDSGLSGGEIARIAESLGVERGGEIVAKAMRSLDPAEARLLASTVDPTLLWGVRRHPLKGSEGRLLDAAAEAARSLREALAYAETGEPGRADMSRYYAEKSLEALGSAAESVGGLTRASVEALARTSASIVDALEGGAPSLDGLLSSLWRLGPPRALQVLRGLYSRATPEARRLLVRAAASMLYRFSAREGLRLLPRTILSQSPPGRLEVRRTVFRLSRMAPDPLVFRRRLRSRSVSLALDVSGSMIEHSIWALSIALLFSSNVSRLVLFSSEPLVVEGPFTPRRLAETLLAARFAGYTDIAGALDAAAAGGSRRLVLVSDLHQTVAPGDPAEVAASLTRRGYRILAIAPPSHHAETRRRLEEAGAKVRVAYTPRDAAREVLRSILR